MSKMPPHSRTQDLLKDLVGKASDNKMRLFAVRCCRRVSDILTEHWHEGIEVADRFANGQASRDELIATLVKLKNDFKEIVESDNGERYAAKLAVLGALSADSPFDPSATALAASRSVGYLRDDEDAQREEDQRQAELLQEIMR